MILSLQLNVQTSDRVSELRVLYPAATKASTTTSYIPNFFRILNKIRSSVQCLKVLDQS